LVRVELNLHEPVPLTEFAKFPSLARIILSDTISIVGAGVIRALTGFRRSACLVYDHAAPFLNGTPFSSRVCVAIITSHFLLAAHTLKQAESKFGLTQRKLAGELDLAVLEGANLVSLNTETRRSPEEMKVLLSFIKEGGTVVLTVKSVQAFANMPLLGMLGMSLSTMNIPSGVKPIRYYQFPILTPEQRKQMAKLANAGNTSVRRPSPFLLILLLSCSVPLLIVSHLGHYHNHQHHT